ncbi:hypothetical protein SAMN06295905_2643 [Devosia lucknowensis]|uniref:Uncharacterized protein n=1 Tax=Devosia lucknowensis TaxID=1096929 RepID=A0A1Y6G5M4_9HYPH|nr:hypothetical protein [Devosia lucknowensis]SMQ85366.1 hypothetical protein SAMN06295905_2643 [Devosia lucknowensis]
MVHFFGILTPGPLKRQAADEAPHKANFFGGIPDIAAGAVPMTRAEQDACYLGGKGPEPDRAAEDATSPAADQ